uniref:Uncharacterized protein n=1 Tax=Glossina pallidipes TaxID=7398 RepID=A0A1B0ADW5_GLOPL
MSIIFLDELFGKNVAGTPITKGVGAKSNCSAQLKHVGNKVTSILVDPGTGTGVDNKRNIHVSISLTSCNTMEEVVSVACPANTVHTLSRVNFCEDPTRFGEDDSLQAKQGIRCINIV